MSLAIVSMIFILREVFSQYTLIYEAFESWDSEGWNIQNQQFLTAECGDSNILGFFENDVKITNLFSLPPHSRLQIQLILWNNGWAACGELIINIDGQQIISVPVFESNPCGQDQAVLHWEISHNFNTAAIIIYTQNQDQTWGISDFKLKVLKCPLGCLICNGDDQIPQDCLGWKLAYYSLSVLDTRNFTIEGWKITNYENEIPISICSNIPMVCGYENNVIEQQINLPTHTQIRIQFKLFEIDSCDGERANLFIDNYQYLYHPSPDEGVQICGDSYYDWIYNIEISLQHFSNILNLKLTQDFQTQSGLRDVYIFIDQRACVQYDYDCCGDSIKQQGEDCDDGNSIPFDGCHNCQYSCVDGCQNCINGQCIDDWVNYKTFDQSQLLPLINEFNPFPCNQDCDICINSVCLKCLNNFQLILGECITKECEAGFTSLDDQCIVICGDGKLNKEQEECDDGNDIPYDGCFNCLYQCEKECQSCEKGICLDKCQYGYYYDNQECVSKCGDKIIAGLEECDDGNDDEYDGCYQCKLQCPKYCMFCENGKCLECQNNFIIDLIQNICTNICGDGILTTPLEKCDDSNTQSSDGCSNQCQIESSWVCKENEECAYYEQSSFQVQYLDQINECQYVSLSFTQQMKRISNSTIPFTDFIHFSFLQNESYSVNIIPIQAASTSLSWIYYQVEIIINVNLNYRPTLMIDLKEILYNKEDIPMINTNQVVLLNIPKFISETQLQASQNLFNTQKTMIYSIGGVGVALLITGFGNVLWSNLDMLQEISYLRFINVDYPQNLMIFFETSDIVQLQSYIQKFNILSQFQYYQETTGKFKFYEINASLAFNIQSLVFSLVFLFVFYLFIKEFSKIINKLNGKHFQNNFFISNQIHKISFQSNKIRYITLKYAFDQILQQSSWSLLFMVLIQIYYHSLIQSIFALILLICYIIYILQSKQLKKIDLLYKIKQMNFMAVLVFCQQNQLIQVISIAFIFTIYLVCLLKCKMIDNKLEYCKKIVFECCLLILAGSSYGFIDGSFFELSYEQKVDFGWLIISVIIFIVIFYTLCDSFRFLKGFSEILRKKFAIMKQNNCVQDQKK